MRRRRPGHGPALLGHARRPSGGLRRLAHPRRDGHTRRRPSAPGRGPGISGLCVQRRASGGRLASREGPAADRPPLHRTGAPPLRGGAGLGEPARVGPRPGRRPLSDHPRGRVAATLESDGTLGLARAPTGRVRGSRPPEPSAAPPETTAEPDPREEDPCAALVQPGVDLALAGSPDAAKEHLAAAASWCPDSSAPCGKWPPWSFAESAGLPPPILRPRPCGATPWTGSAGSCSRPVGFSPAGARRRWPPGTGSTSRAWISSR